MQFGHFVTVFVVEISFKSELTDHTNRLPVHGVVNPFLWDHCLHKIEFCPLKKPDILFAKIEVIHRGSAADSDPSDPYVYGSPGSVSASQRYGSDPDPSIIKQK